MVIVVSGPLDILKIKLLAISTTVKNRKYNGWPPFQSDELWLYESEQDDRVCPICQGFENDQYFSGDAIPHNFPTEEQINPLSYVHPRVHEAHPELRGQCRCSLTWLNAREVLVERLTREIEEVI